MFDGIGIAMIISCIIILSLSKGKETKVGTSITSEDKTSEDNTNKMLAIIFALASGLCFFLNSVAMFYDLSLGFSPMQMNIDGNFVYGLVLLPFFLYEQINY